MEPKYKVQLNYSTNGEMTAKVHCEVPLGIEDSTCCRTEEVTLSGGAKKELETFCKSLIESSCKSLKLNTTVDAAVHVAEVLKANKDDPRKKSLSFDGNLSMSGQLS